MAITVRTMLKNKNSQVWSVSPQSTVLEALRLMAEKGIGAVLVMDGDRLVGIFSERDYARRGVLQGRGVESKIDEVMTSPVSAISLDRSVEDCLAIMTDHHFRHLPVMESGKVVGVVSIGDVVKNMLDDQRETISGLENYIMGRR
jgi:CBS domain-containing protein